METRPIYENLDTSFVNLTALLRYLRLRQFVGQVRIEMSGYEAEILLLENNRTLAYEHDRIAGKRCEGEEALQKILLRTRQPGGGIHVFQRLEVGQKQTKTLPNGQPLVKKSENGNSLDENFPAKTSTKGQPSIEPSPLAAKDITVPKPDSNGQPKAQTNGAAKSPVAANNEIFLPIKAKPTAPPKAKVLLPDFPFKLSNHVETKTKHPLLSPDEWRTLLQLTAELLGTIDKTLAGADLDFSAGFKKACSEIAGDYPFLNPAAKIFEYGGGKITIRGQMSAKVFAAGINESTRRVLEKLASKPKFHNVYREAVQKILALIHRRKPLYDKFSITPQLERNLGV